MKGDATGGTVGWDEEEGSNKRGVDVSVDTGYIMELGQFAWFAL